MTVPADSTIQINCTNDLRVNIDNITVKQAVTKCQKREQCSVTDDEINAIKLNCTDKVSCEVKNANHGCIQDYGYYNLTYDCQGKFLVCLHYLKRTNAKSVDNRLILSFGYNEQQFVASDYKYPLCI